MLYLSGAKNAVISDDLRDGTIGLLQTPKSGYRLEGVAVWAMDNGCFTDAYPGDDGYMSLLARYEKHKERCLFVTVPDVVGDGAATLARFQPMAGRIKSSGWPVALVAQDGMTADLIPWTDIDWMFVGGSTEWKKGMDAAALILAAKGYGVKVHVGRVNSAKRFAHFAGLGADTSDGTFIAFGPDKNSPKVREWMRQNVQGVLMFIASVNRNSVTHIPVYDRPVQGFSRIMSVWMFPRVEAQ